MMNPHNYPTVIYPAEEGGFVAEVPALHGCLAQGETMEDCLKELDVVKALWIETAISHGQHLPDVDEAIRKVKVLSR